MNDDKQSRNNELRQRRTNAHERALSASPSSFVCIYSMSRSGLHHLQTWISLWDNTSEIRRWDFVFQFTPCCCHNDELKRVLSKLDFHFFYKTKLPFFMSVDLKLNNLKVLSRVVNDARNTYWLAMIIAT